jgi:peptidyl-tRNA hydrolase, PTH1 family
VKWIVGLGNPGRRFEGTRHNLGFLVVERLRRETGAASRTNTPVLRRYDLRSEDLGLVMPQTFMNRSGVALAELGRTERIDPSELLVVADDLHLPLGRMRLRGSGGAGGHNGLKSVIEHLGTQDFARLRVGVGRPDDAGGFADFVLEEFEEDEEPLLAEMVERACEASLTWSREGLAAAMNRFNA